MNRKVVGSMTAAVLAVLGMSSPAVAQYPQVPADVKAAGDARQAEAAKLSKANWEKAQEQMKADEANGRYFRPWAARPEDLPQAGIPAFPGAEGGGMYSHGGRGGKVYVVTSPRTTAVVTSRCLRINVPFVCRTG